MKQRRVNPQLPQPPSDCRDQDAMAAYFDACLRFNAAQSKQKTALPDAAGCKCEFIPSGKF